MLEHMLSNVAVVILDSFTPFELGVVCEVFGVDRRDDGLPPYDFAVVAGEPGPLRSANGFTVAPRHGLDRLEEADLVAVPAVTNDRIAPVAGRAARTAAGRPCAGARAAAARVLSVCTGRSCSARPACWTAGAAPPTGGTPPAGPDLPGGQGRPRRAVRGRRPGDHQRGHRGRHRRLPAPGPPGAGQPGGQRHRPPDGGAAAPRRRPGAVRRAAAGRAAPPTPCTPCWTG